MKPMLLTLLAIFVIGKCIVPIAYVANKVTNAGAEGRGQAIGNLLNSASIKTSIEENQPAPHGHSGEGAQSHPDESTHERRAKNSEWVSHISGGLLAPR